MDCREQVMTTLELASEKVEDLTDEVYRVFFEKMPHTRKLFITVSAHGMGLMLNDTLAVLMGYPDEDSKKTVRSEVDVHHSYDVTGEMYRPFLESVKEAVANTLGDQWSEEFESAWSEQIETVMGALDASLAKYKQA